MRIEMYWDELLWLNKQRKNWKILIKPWVLKKVQIASIVQIKII